MASETTLSSDRGEPARGDAERPRPTMRDVAALAGVSLKTVSRVINQEPGVSTELVERVHLAAHRLAYRPNLTASNLRRADGKTATIGLLLEDVSNPYSSAVHRAVEERARERGVLVFAASLDEDADRERALVDAFVARRVDGLIIAPASHDHSYLIDERRSGVDVVFVDRPPRYLEADAVLTSDADGAAMATAHLIAHGHDRIAMLGDLRSIPTAALRRDGYERALREAGITPDPSLVIGDMRTSDAAESTVRRLLLGDAPPTALFTAQNLITIGAIRALRSLGLQHRIALTGFDDVALADLLDPGITVVAQDPARIGELAAEILFRRLDGDRSPASTVVVPTILVPRGSGEIVAT